MRFNCPMAYAKRLVSLNFFFFFLLFYFEMIKQANINNLFLVNFLTDQVMTF